MSFFAKYLEAVLDALEARGQTSQLSRGELDEVQFQYKRACTVENACDKIVSMRAQEVAAREGQA